jgi:ZIP family zinc transporter/zinc and cadmium transporter
MELRIVLLLILGLIASVANLVGAWIVSSRAELRRPLLNIFVSAGAGFMLAAAFLEVVPRSVRLHEYAAFYILAGYLFVHLVEHTIATHFHFGEETHTDEILGTRAAYSALVGLVLHAFFDGALIASGFWISTNLGVLLFLAIVLHKIPEGFTAASILRASGKSKSAMNAAAVAISVSNLAGVLSVGFIETLVRTALPFSAGVTVYVAASDLIPEVNKESRGAVSLGVFVGVVLFLLSERFLALAIGS